MLKVTVLEMVREYIYSYDWRYLFVHEDGTIWHDNPYDNPEAEKIGWWKLEEGVVYYDLGN